MYIKSCEELVYWLKIGLLYFFSLRPYKTTKSQDCTYFKVPGLVQTVYLRSDAGHGTKLIFDAIAIPSKRQGDTLVQ
jgi:hypothetical protein